MKSVRRGHTVRFRLAAGVALAIWAALPGRPGPARGESPPEVIRVRVPAGRVSAYFPPGTALRTLAADQFDALVAAGDANDRAVAADQAAAPRRPARVEHSARWDGGALAGRSRVVFPADPTAVAVLCDPWSPALVAAAEREAFARVDAAGRLVLAAPARPAPRAVEFSWHQVAPADSAGRSFALRLPAADVAVLTLDLPAGVVPIANAAGPEARRGPEPADEPGRARWEFVGAAGWFPVHLAAIDPARPDRPRVGGPTRIDLDAVGANWAADWQVEAPAGAPPTCRIELDPGLELLDAAGPDVLGFRAEPADRPGGPTRVEVRLRAPAAPRSRAVPLAIRGLVRPPLVGTWPIPAARPIDADWAGGRTEVRLDPARRLVGVDERAGRRVAARPQDGTPAAALVFEADARPGPVAQLRFGRPDPDASVAVDGTLRLGPFAPQVEVVATWTLDRGRLGDPTLDFPPGWVVDRVAGGDGESAGPWHSEALPGGGGRLHLGGPVWAAEPPGRVIVRAISATRVGADPTTPADHVPLPRVRPAAGPVLVADERWAAAVAPGWEVDPTSTRGLDWIDPPTTTPAADPASAPGLAWRWRDDDAAATVVRRRVEVRPRVDDRLEAAIVAGRLRLAWTWTVAAAGRPDSLPFHLDLGPGGVARWRVVERSTEAVIAPRDLDPARRAGLGFPTTGAAARVELDQLPPGPVTIRGEADLAWAGTGPIPLARFPAAVATRRSVVVRVEEAAGCRIDRAVGLTPVGLPGAVESPQPGAEAEGSPVGAIVGEAEQGLRVAAAWVGDGDGPAALAISTRRGPGSAGDESGQGVVTEAAFVSRLAPGLPARHRLTLRVVPGPARSIDLRLPAGALLDRVRRDGQPIAPEVVAGALRVPLAPADSTRPTGSITLDYRTADDGSGSGRVEPTRFLPALAVPCLSFTWQVNAPERFAVRSESPDLIATEPADPGAADDGAAAPAMLADLDAALLDAPPVETTLGDWLVKLDAGRWPLVVDRLALTSVGWGPRSRITAAEAAADRPTGAVAAFHALGLTVEPVGAMFLVATEADQRADVRRGRAASGGRAALRAALLDASIAGSDRSDRYQAPARWLGEPTPRAWLASETPDRGQVALGWRSHRFAAAGWPTPALAVRLVEDRSFWRPIGLGLVGLAALGYLVRGGRAGGRAPGRRAALILAGCCLATGPSTDGQDQAARPPEPAEPIVALLPYDDLAAIEAPPARVILRAVDHNRLARRAAARPPAAAAPVALVAATHRVAAPADGSVAVASRVALEVAGPGGGSWSFPVGAGRDLAASVDGAAVPLRISPDGRAAAVEALPAGRSTVEFRRSIPVVAAPGPPGAAGSIRVEVGPAAFGRVEVERADGAAPVGLPDLAGRLESRPDELAGELGPRDRFEVRWGAPGPDPAGRPEVGGLIRWDAHPAADRVVARLTVLGDRPLGSIRLGLEPGLAVVGHSIAGLVGSSTVGPPARPEWVAVVDPPLAPGASFEVTLGRAAPAPGEPRAVPRWELVGGRLAGLIACRRPEGWSGRLEPPSTAGDPVAATEAEFARRWGPVPPDGLVPAGVAAWPVAAGAVVPLAPEAPERVVRDRVEVEVVPGGLRFVAEAALADRTGTPWEAELRFDGAVRVHRVEAAGLASWSQAAPDRVGLVFGGSKPARERTVRLHGTVAVPPPAGDEREPAVAAAVPWPRWPGAAGSPGELIVTATAAVAVRSGDRPVAAIEAGPAPATPPAPLGGPTRQAFAVDRPAAPLELAWAPPTAWVGVTVASDLRLDPRQVVWSADVTCTATGGPVRTLHWKLPTAWADGATLASAAGDTPRIAAETHDESTFWTITLDRPIWGRRTLTIRSARPSQSGSVIGYPEVALLSAPGRGAVDGYELAVTDLSGSAPRIDHATGLVPLPAAGSGRSAIPGGIASRAYRVAGDRWSLGLRLDPNPPDFPEQPGRFDDSRRLARLDRADFLVGIDSTLRSAGQATCRVEPGAAFLAVTLPRGARLLGGAVDGRPTGVVAPGPGDDERWLIPLGDGPGRQVGFAWVGPPDPGAGAQAGGDFVPLPRFDQAGVPTSVRAYSTAEGPDLAMAGGNWTRVGPLDAATARIEQAGAAIIAGARRGDLAPAAPDAATALDRLAGFALDLRAARRAFRVADAPGRPDLAAWAAIEARVEAAVAEAGGADLLAQVAGRIGPGVAAAKRDLGDGFGAGRDVYRIRRIGRAEAFEGSTSPDPGQPPGLVVQPRTP